MKAEGDAEKENNPVPGDGNRLLCSSCLGCPLTRVCGSAVASCCVWESAVMPA